MRKRISKTRSIKGYPYWVPSFFVHNNHFLYRTVANLHHSSLNWWHESCWMYINCLNKPIHLKDMYKAQTPNPFPQHSYNPKYRISRLPYNHTPFVPQWLDATEQL